MANKTKATPQKEEAREEGPETPDAPLPLLDLSDAAVTKMIKQAKKRGYVTHQQLNAVIPSEEVTSEQIEHILAALNEMGISAATPFGKVLSMFSALPGILQPSAPMPGHSR